MISWRGQSLKELPRAELESVATEAAMRLLKMSEEQRNRESANDVVLALLTGVALALAAIAFGLMLR
jgi:hypothetical protein